MSRNTPQTKSRETISTLWPLARSLLLPLLMCGWIETPAEAQTPTADSFNPGADGAVYSLAVQVDGKILVGGEFLTVGRQSRNFIARLNSDGSLDSTFNPGVNSAVYSLVVQADGSILVGGRFTTMGSQQRTNIARLNPDGSLDSSFNPGASGGVVCLAVQADGKVLVGGYFQTLGGQPRRSIARLNADGTLDPNFNPGASGMVNTLAIQSDGRILVGGDFSMQGGWERDIARLNADGTLDPSFYPGASGEVYCLAVQADGKVLMSGDLTTLAGQPRVIVQLNTDGTLNPDFDWDADSLFAITSLAVQADGKFLAGADGYLTRLYADGTRDSTFTPSASGYIYGLTVQANGKALVGGSFTTMGSQQRTNIARLSSTSPAAETLSYDGATITWLRGGTAPEVWRTTFEHTTNQTLWTVLGAGVRITGGWQLGGVSVPPGNIRARGFTPGGNHNASGGIVEAVWGVPIIVAQPASCTNVAETSAAFTVGMVGSTPFSYSWRKDGSKLTDSGSNVVGATTATLLKGLLSGSDAGGYDVVVSNAYGSVTSVMATLTVPPLAIYVQPASRTNNAGTIATFSVTVAGSSPFSYRWRKDAVNLADGGRFAGTTAASVSLSAVLGSDVGGYDVVVSNSYGSVTSAVANLTVVDPVINVHPISQIGQLGSNITFAISAVGVGLNYQWRKNGSALAGALSPSLTLTNLQAADAGNYDALVCSAYGCVGSSIAELSVNLALPEQGFNPSAGHVYSLAMQPNGKILVGGDFSSVSGQTRNRLARLNPNGTLDPSFNPGADSAVYSLAVQSDAKVLVGGNFTTLNGQARSRLARLNEDGVLDSTFNPGANSDVTSLAVQGDGKILVGGTFTTLGGSARNRLARLNRNGALDTNFNPSANSEVSALAVQGDGKILAGGIFTTLGGQPRNRIARLNPDGALDLSFNPGTDGPIYSQVLSLAVQADGRILVGGLFTGVGGQPRTNIARLNTDGTIDATFNPGAGGPVYSLAVQADGKILAGGLFTSMGGQPRQYIARLNVNGTSDPNFNPGANGFVYSLTLQSDGKVLVGGYFAMLGGLPRNGLARLINTSPAAVSLSYTGDTITWMRGGTAPEVWRTAFEHTTNGSLWTMLGAGVRIPGGWQLSEISPAAGGMIRASGHVSGGDKSSGWFVETVLDLGALNGPVIVVDDGQFGIRANGFGFKVTCNSTASVVVEASTDFMQWTPLSTNSLSSNSTFFIDPNWTQTPRRFYRARLRP